MTKKMLLLGSLGAMLLSVTLLITPAGALIGSNCTQLDCGKLVDGGVAVEVHSCEQPAVTTCACPLPPPLLFNNCSQ